MQVSDISYDVITYTDKSALAIMKTLSEILNPTPIKEEKVKTTVKVFDKRQPNMEQALFQMFLFNIEEKRPFVLLKWAQTYDRFEKVAAFLYELSATNNIEKNLLFGDIPYTHQEIADSLAISRVTVTKVLNQFKDEGLISIEYGHIKVLKRDKLYEQYLSTLV